MREPLPQSVEGLRIRLLMALDACVQSGYMSEREKRVVVMRLALADGRWHTLAATGSAIGGLGKERVRQIQNRAIWKLRQHAEIHELLRASLRQISLPRKTHRRPPWLAPNRLPQGTPTGRAEEQDRQEEHDLPPARGLVSRRHEERLHRRRTHPQKSRRKAGHRLFADPLARPIPLRERDRTTYQVLLVMDTTQNREGLLPTVDEPPRHH